MSDNAAALGVGIIIGVIIIAVATIGAWTDVKLAELEYDNADDADCADDADYVPDCAPDGAE